jgi:hypothetical protein
VQGSRQPSQQVMSRSASLSSGRVRSVVWGDVVRHGGGGVQGLVQGADGAQSR